MKKVIAPLFLMAAAVVAAAAVVVAALPAPAAASSNPVLDLASILSGTFQGTTPGNELRLDLRPVPTDEQHPYDLFLEIAGKYQGQSVRRQGLVRMETAGKDVYVGYVPHFDPTVTSMSADATKFTPSETTAACGFHLKPLGDGFTGETAGSSCAVALRGVTGKWTIELEPGGLRLRSNETGETLRFRRVSK
jgi:hypothetical protein